MTKTPIPWCTTHDESLPHGELVNVEPRCWFDYFYGVKDGDGNRLGSRCVISKGGRNHKWWRNK